MTIPSLNQIIQLTPFIIFKFSDEVFSIPAANDICCIWTICCRIFGYLTEINFMVAILNQGPSDGTGRRGKVLRLYRLTLNQKDNQGPQTIQEYSYPKVRPWMNNRRCLNSIQQQVLYLYNFQGHMYNHDGTLSTQLNCNIRHRNLIEGLRLKIWLGELSKYHDSRVTIFCLGIIETEQNLWNRFDKSIARWIAQVERHIRLSHQLASNNFAHLNI